MKIYTRTGDDGKTGRLGKGRVSKAHTAVEAYGTVDELNAHLGWILSTATPSPWDQRLREIQGDLLTLGSHLAVSPSAGGAAPRLPDPPRERIAAMESWIDELEQELPPLQRFLLPGGHPAAARMHIARAVCRRAERRIAALQQEEPVPDWCLPYLNRLSDLLFMLARWLNRRFSVPEHTWPPGSDVP